MLQVDSNLMNLTMISFMLWEIPRSSYRYLTYDKLQPFLIRIMMKMSIHLILLLLCTIMLIQISKEMQYIQLYVVSLCIIAIQNGQ